jgi:hypothetical protein
MSRAIAARPSLVPIDHLPGALKRVRIPESRRFRQEVWDNAAWHVSRRVRAWIKVRNRRAKAEGARIITCWLPIKAPWLNAIEPKWVHGKRSVVEPERKLTAAEVVERVCSYNGGEPVDPLTQQVA